MDDVTYRSSCKPLLYPAWYSENTLVYFRRDVYAGYRAELPIYCCNDGVLHKPVEHKGKIKLVHPLHPWQSGRVEGFRIFGLLTAGSRGPRMPLHPKHWESLLGTVLVAPLLPRRSSCSVEDPCTSALIPIHHLLRKRHKHKASVNVSMDRDSRATPAVWPCVAAFFY